MLIISRRPRERLRIGDEIEIKVTKVQGNSVFLGITAPKHISIARSELNKKSADDSPIDSVAHDLV
ncbi:MULTISPECIES: carbon storage regulator [unclassified Pseudomonas]|uniref:carbon storage regulator n=1 Tax=unclassified Pseudomonas TaxID=196821 RepID=UPI0015A48538|nr:carbon storage regulator [Pseudomonas sp. IPO3779]NWD15636.1 carbon storage regulator [Pseudomonas sp. IPO3778]